MLKLKKVEAMEFLSDHAISDSTLGIDKSSIKRCRTSEKLEKVRS